MYDLTRAIKTHWDGDATLAEISGGFFLGVTGTRGAGAYPYAQLADAGGLPLEYTFGPCRAESPRLRLNVYAPPSLEEALRLLQVASDSFDRLRGNSRLSLGGGVYAGFIREEPPQFMEDEQKDPEGNSVFHAFVTYRVDVFRGF